MYSNQNKYIYSYISIFSKTLNLADIQNYLKKKLHYYFCVKTDSLINQLNKI